MQLKWNLIFIARNYQLLNVNNTTAHSDIIHIVAAYASDVKNRKNAFICEHFWAIKFVCAGEKSIIPG